MDYYMAFDTETGGLKPEKHSLLTAYFAFCIKNDKDEFEVIDDLSLSLLDPTGEFRITPQAMEVNRIDLRKHRTEAISPIEGARLLFEKMEKYSKGGKITLIGQNIPFDEGFINVNLIPKSIWGNMVYVDPKMKRDTREILGAMKMQGKIPAAQSLSLGKVAEYLGVSVDSESLHNAKYDVLLTIKVLEKTMKM